jgi:hypothetical protein
MKKNCASSLLFTKIIPRCTVNRTCKIRNLFKLGLVDSPQCNRCKQLSETASHMLYDCDTVVVLRYRHLGHQSFLETRLLCKHLHQQGNDCTLFQVCGTAKCVSKGLHKRWDQSRCKGHCSACPTLTVLY